MPICPKCKCEYREGFKYCSDCNIELIDDEEFEKNNEKITCDKEDEWIFLKNLDDRNEINILEPLFKSEDIPILKNYKEAGEYLKIYMGMTSFGIDVYVPKSKYDTALKILKDLKLDSLDSNNEIEKNEKNKNNNEYNTFKRKKHLNVWLILLFLIVPGLIFYLSSFINKLYSMIINYF
jgi:hypothetical protein